MALSEIKAIAAQGLIQQRLIVEAAGLNIANANRVVNQGTNIPLYRVEVESNSFADLISGKNNNGPQIVSASAPLKSHFSPTDPNADAQGMVWRPDINTTQQLIDVVSANRAYEANLRIYNAASSMGKKIMKLGGN
ncbi:flagellar basal body rod C-terminal domain-containing protein [Photobacterium kasasachensis]|uniref:flagellar basal body rod C-terminal domain-containing protein n=1 Tax=Photobacterium kasasachensis TaxID=2910240 RepID=UPI003D0C06EE